MKYDQYNFLFPPRPETALPPDELKFYRERGWVGQYKKNGTCTTIAISPEKDIICKERHGRDHKLWDITPYLQSELKRLFPENAWVYLIAELLHSKTKEVKNTLYFHDILVFDNEYLLGSKFIERQEILNAHLKENAIAEEESHYVCDVKNKIWFAKLLSPDQDYESIFWQIKDQNIDEGLVLKDPKGKLAFCHQESNKNQIWQAKFRHPKKSYNF